MLLYYTIGLRLAFNVTDAVTNRTLNEETTVTPLPSCTKVVKANLNNALRFRLGRLASFHLALQPGDSIGYSFYCLSLSFALLQVPRELVVADYVPDPVAEIAPGLM